MSRTLIDIDDEALREAAEALGASTKVDTVNMALRETAQRHKARAAGRDLLEALTANPDFGDPNIRAWR